MRISALWHNPYTRHGFHRQKGQSGGSYRQRDREASAEGEAGQSAGQAIMQTGANLVLYGVIGGLLIAVGVIMAMFSNRRKNR